MFNTINSSTRDVKHTKPQGRMQHVHACIYHGLMRKTALKQINKVTHIDLWQQAYTHTHTHTHTHTLKSSS